MLHKKIAHQDTNIPSTSGIKKTTLAVSVAFASVCLSTLASAALNPGSALSMGAQSYDCNFGLGTYPDCVAGSYPDANYFAMDNDGSGVWETTERVAISPGTDGGITLGAPQALGGIDAAWDFFGATGYHYTPVTGVAVATDDGGGNVTLDMSGWTVNWNGGDIDMGQGADAVVTCGNTCENGDTFTLDYNAVVPDGGFAGVAYAFHIEGTISSPGAVPQAVDDSATTIVGNPVDIDVLQNDTSADPFIAGSVTIETQASNGNAVDNPDDTVTYTPDIGPDFIGRDTFKYTVDNTNGTSNPATVTVDVEVNLPPVANNDQGSTNTGALNNSGGTLEINVLKNDTDPNNDPGLPGGIDVMSVNILTQPSTGSCTADAKTGKVTYSQGLPSVPVSTTCTYEVKDIDISGTPLVSNVATIDIDITSLNSDWPPSLDPDIIPFLIYEDGVPNKSNNTADKPESGTYFSMDVSANTTIYTTLTKGPDGGFVIGYNQPATGSHTGAPTGDETSSVDLGWNFFGNTGLTFTMNGGITGNSDGTLKFSGDNGGKGRYQITWNGIPEIDLGGSDQFPEDLGFALITCNPAPCADGSSFDMTYEAHVPPGDPSGFGGVQYRLVMNGEVKFLDGSFQTSDGTFSLEERLSTSDVEPDPDSEIQCAGGCFDYTITDVNDPAVSVVLPLNGGVPASTLGEIGLRVFRDGEWGNFDTSGNDSVLSAPFTSGGDFGTTCPPPGDAAYGTLTEGHQCLQVTIQDNGPNDKNGKVGEITDPSGLGIPTIVTGPDNRKSGTSGCAVASTPVSPLRGGAWWMLAGLAGWMGWKRRQSKLH